MESLAEFWNVPETSGLFLHELAVFWAGTLEDGIGLDGDFNILEIGTSNGFSGICFARAVKRMGRGRVYTIESHAERYALAGENFIKEGVEDVIVRILGHAPEVFSDEGAIKKVIGDRHPTSRSRMSYKWPLFDFVFFDATKMEYESYLKAVLPLMKPGGLIVADNCLSHGRELKAFLEGVGEDGFLLPLDNGLLMIRPSTLKQPGRSG